MTYTGINSEEAYQAIQEKIQVQKDRGYGIISPGSALDTGSYAVTINSGALNVSDTLTVGTSGDEALDGGNVVSLSAATDVGISGVNTASDGTEQYRYDTIWVDSSGEVNKTEGTVVKLSTEEANNNLTNFQRFRAAIPEPATYPSAVVAAVVVSSDDSSIGSDNLRDFRIEANSLNDNVSALELNGPVTGLNTISDLVGSGLEVVSNSLQVLSSIWDSANSEIVADVNNAKTTTNALEADRATVNGSIEANNVVASTLAEEKWTSSLAENAKNGQIVHQTGQLATSGTWEDWVYIGNSSKTIYKITGVIGASDLISTVFVILCGSKTGKFLTIIQGDGTNIQLNAPYVQFKADRSSYGLSVSYTLEVIRK